MSVTRTPVPAGDGAKLVSRQQLADADFAKKIMAAMKIDRRIRIIDPESTMLDYDGEYIPAESPAGVARIEALQMAWAKEIEGIAAAPTLEKLLAVSAEHRLPFQERG